jgi:hypothetical protein
MLCYYPKKQEASGRGKSINHFPSLNFGKLWYKVDKETGRFLNYPN